MYIESLELKNFRNYEELSIVLDPGTNILYGDNAQGKTNVLEAVYLCGTTKSHRGSKDKEMIRFEQDESHIRMMVKKDGVSHKIDMHLKKNKAKGIAIDGIPIRKAAELFGIVNLVAFSPEDLNIIKNGPSERRRFMDLELCQLNKVYLQELTSYNKVLNQRNKLLKDIGFQPGLTETLDVWDMQLVSYGKKIISLRRQFMEELGEIIRQIHSTGDQCRRSDLIQFVIAQAVDVSKQCLSQRRSKSHRRLCSKILRRQGTHQSQHAQCDHQRAHSPDIRLVAILDTDIDDVCHNDRNQQFKTGFQHFKQRCNNRLFFIRFQILKHLFHLRFPPALLRFSEEQAFSGKYLSASAVVR